MKPKDTHISPTNRREFLKAGSAITAGLVAQAALPAARVQGSVRRDPPAFCLAWRFLLHRARSTRRVVAAAGGTAAGLAL